MRLHLTEDRPGETREPGAGERLARAIRGLLEAVEPDLGPAESALCKGALDTAPHFHGDGEVHALGELAAMMGTAYERRLGQLQASIAAAVRGSP